MQTEIKTSTTITLTLTEEEAGELLSDLQVAGREGVLTNTGREVRSLLAGVASATPHEAMSLGDEVVIAKEPFYRVTLSGKDYPLSSIGIGDTGTIVEGRDSVGDYLVRFDNCTTHVNETCLRRL